MKLAVISHKRCWKDNASATGYSTYGGFPLQMQALSRLFDETVLVLPEVHHSRPEGLMPLEGNGMRVRALTQPEASNDFMRKMAMLWWFPKNILPLWKEIAAADVIHTPVPGDIGQIGMLIAFIRRKRLILRHGGIWFTDATLARKVLKWIMERYASATRIMFATGYDERPPSEKNPYIKWIFSTSLTEAEIQQYARVRTLEDPAKARLIIVARQAPEKNIDRLLEAFRMLKERFPGLTLTLVGDGPLMEQNKKLAVEKSIDDSVVFKGNLQHDGVMAALQEADVFVFPTNAEGFPKSILESLASGVPVVSTAVSVIPHLLSNGSGLLLKDKAPETIADTVAKVLEDPATYHRMSEQAVETALRYSLEKWAESMQQAMKDAWNLEGKS